ncbi:hypothetical protein [Hyphobacterium marinum]|uniref:Hedgehog/Intein (Hint) domain-containing protein n=1 Tax=Hyphobacterium marinum TaxID=3116574 RepID=A0ABU7LZ36_9PROT|nr:hypothetical protein [Hyphobacterium sp. Y6023]MEE2566455.1 hypothetical protein [Hyphobacterium sp. Y6023]
MAYSTNWFDLIENQIADFHYDDEGAARLTMTKTGGIVSAILVPEGGTSRPLDSSPSGEIAIPFPALDEEFASEVEKNYELQVRYEDGDVALLQLKRQNPAILKERFNIEKPEGYTIAGRNNFIVGDGPLRRDVSLKAERGKGVDIAPFSCPVFKSPELNTASQILSWIFDGQICIGPRKSSSYPTVTEEMAAVRDAQDSIQCGDLCWIWAAVAHNHGLTFRFVGLYSYGPRFPDLVSKSHAVVELDTEDGPVLLDLWGNRIFYADGRFLSTEDLITALRVKNQFVLSHSLANVDNIEVMYKNKERGKIKTLFSGVEDYKNVYLNYVEISSVQTV